jgi:hypothetical protein
MAKSQEEGLFQHSTPRLDRCCLCERPGGPFRLERRPTGAGGIWQAWPYCRSCWQASQVSIPDPLGYRVLLYAVFEHDPRRFRPEVGELEGKEFS